MEETKRFGIFDGFWLKIIAMVLMTIDHIGIFLSASSSTQSLGLLFRIIGRVSFPLFIFLLAEGMRHTSRPFRYVLRLFGVYAAITLVETIAVYGFPDVIGYTPNSLSPHPFTDLVLIGLTLACLRQKGAWKWLALLPAGVVILSYGCDVYDCFHPSNVNHWFPFYLRAGYGIFGLLIALGFYFAPAVLGVLFRKPLNENGVSVNAFIETSSGRKALNIVSITLFFLVTVLLWGISYLTPKGELGGGIDMSLETYCLFATPFLYFYNGKRGYDSKIYRFIAYWYFPVHLIVLFLIFSI